MINNKTLLNYIPKHNLLLMKGVHMWSLVMSDTYLIYSMILLRMFLMKELELTRAENRDETGDLLYLRLLES